MKQSAFASWTTRTTFVLGSVLEVTAFADELFHVKFMGAQQENVAKFGALLLLVSIYMWLEASHKSLAKLEEMSVDLKRSIAVSEGRDLAARYGAVPAALIKLLHSQEHEETQFSHLRAGGLTLKELVIETYSEAAKSFTTLKETRGGSLQLQERSIINMFLLNLAHALPPKSVWLGTSRLQDVRAWNEHSAEASYHLFEQKIETRVTASDLSCFRLFCYEDGQRLEQMTSVLRRQAEIGIKVRTLLKRPLPADMTLLWVPKAKLAAKIDSGDPIRYLEQNFEPVCGLKFEIRNDAEVSKMTLSGPTSTDFEDLKIAFSRAWEAATPSQGTTLQTAVQRKSA